MKLVDFFQISEDQEDWEIKNLDKLDGILVQLCELVIEGQKKDSEHYAMVAAAILDPKNRMVSRLNYATESGKRIHAERAAMDAYEKKYGKISNGSIVITTLSPCCNPLEDR